MIALLVDDDQNLLASMRRALKIRRRDWEVLTACDGQEALELLRCNRVDIVVADIQMPGMDGLALLSHVREDPSLNPMPLIIISVLKDRATVRLGMTSGADDYLTKPFTTQELIQAIESRLERLGAVASPSGEMNSMGLHLKEVLTERELEVLGHIGRGMVTKEIATRLELSPQTVSVHRANIMRKLNLHNAAALASMAIRAGVA